MAKRDGKKIYVALERNEIELETFNITPTHNDLQRDKEEEKVRRVGETIKIIWFSPIFDFASFRLYPYVKDYVSFKENCLKSAISVLIVIAIFFCIFLQIIMLLAFLADIVYRPLLFISIHSNITFFSDDHFNRKWSDITVITSSSRLYHMYEDWFLFAWDYLYGIIGFYSTVFLFMNAWNVDNFPGIIKLIAKIVENRVYVHKIKKMKGKEDYNSCKRFLRFISCSDNQMQSCLTKLGWGISHFLIILLSVFVVVYWIVVNAINWIHNSQSNQFLTQASTISFALMIFDSIHWHLSPVIVCFLIRISCMEITTKLIKIRFQYTKLIIDMEKGVENPDKNTFVLWEEYFTLINKASAISKKYQRISAINIIVLVFSVVGISIHYLSNRIDMIDNFIQYDWIDSIRFLVWYCIHIFSVWSMVNEMATLNLALDNLTDEILIILALEGKITVNKEIKTQLKLCRNTTMRFSIDFFGVVTSMTAHLIIAFGSATIGIFCTESLKILVEQIKINGS